MVPAPKLSPHHPDRGLACEEAMQAGFDRLAASAERAGWSRDETAFALLNLAMARILAIDADLDTEDAIEQANRAVHGLA